MRTIKLVHVDNPHGDFTRIGVEDDHVLRITWKQWKLLISSNETCVRVTVFDSQGKRLGQHTLAPLQKDAKIFLDQVYADAFTVDTQGSWGIGEIGGFAIAETFTDELSVCPLSMDEQIGFDHKNPLHTWRIPA